MNDEHTHTHRVLKGLFAIGLYLGIASSSIAGTQMTADGIKFPDGSEQVKAMPDPTGNNKNVLTSNGTSAEWKPGGGGGVIVGKIEPQLSDGGLWFDTDEYRLKVKYLDIWLTLQTSCKGVFTTGISTTTSVPYGCNRARFTIIGTGGGLAYNQYANNTSRHHGFGTGGAGSTVKGTLKLIPGAQLELNVGSAGNNGFSIGNTNAIGGQGGSVSISGGGVDIELTGTRGTAYVDGDSAFMTCGTPGTLIKQIGIQSFDISRENNPWECYQSSGYVNVHDPYSLVYPSALNDISFGVFNPGYGRTWKGFPNVYPHDDDIELQYLEFSSPARNGYIKLEFFTE